VEKKNAEPEPDFASQLKDRLKKKTSEGPTDGTGIVLIDS
jgi:hypothetical protein